MYCENKGCCWRTSQTKENGTPRPLVWNVADIVRLKDGLIQEHWDVIEDEVTKAQSVSILPMIGDHFPS
jgi:predicted SnoaL-like aldol condensation-catalyzing enzyme